MEILAVSMLGAAESSLQRVCASGCRDMGYAAFPQSLHQKRLKLFTNCPKLSLLSVSLQEQDISSSYQQNSLAIKTFPWWVGSFLTKPPPDVLVFLKPLDLSNSRDTRISVFPSMYV